MLQAAFVAADRQRGVAPEQHARTVADEVLDQELVERRPVQFVEMPRGKHPALQVNASEISKRKSEAFPR